MMVLALALWALTACALASEAQAAPRADPHFILLVARLAAEGFERESVARLFSEPGVVYDPSSMGKKIRALYRMRYAPPAPLSEALQDPNRRRTKLWEPHLTPEMLARLKVFRAKYATSLASAEKKYGVPQSVILAVLVVETKLGQFLGENSVFNVLASMAVCTNPEDVAEFLAAYEVTPEQRAWLASRQRDKADWAYEELKSLIAYAIGNGLDPTTMSGSIYGAFGMCQFIPSTAIRLAVDGDGDGTADLNHPPDAVHSVAKFLKCAGWKAKMSRRAKIKAVKRYNPDLFYAKTVLSVADQL